MSTRGAGRAPRRARQTTFAALALAALSLAACGSSDFTNEPPRAAAEIEVTARVDQRAVVVSPDHFGAGLVTFTIANFSDSPVRFTLSGPKHAASEPIPPGAPTTGQEPTAVNLKVELPEGRYEASAGQGANVKSDTVEVGPKRSSSSNKLLLP